MAFVEDLSVFFDTDEFAVTATVGGGGGELTLIFDQRSFDVLGGDISGTQPEALVASADVASLTEHSSTLTISGTGYTVRDIQPDGTGLSRLVLEKA